ncbi:MAG: helix-turn-helix transcriptional regulator [Hyphomicrobiales bacterium]|nr:helix-turn-helix transcriptional regulator [Hyphomicrobiales bacterium]
MSDRDLADNLRLLCGYEKSTSAVCRAIGINRQQFSKYLNGKSRPSPRNFQRICAYFELPLSDLYLPHEIFAERLQFRNRSRERPTANLQGMPLFSGFPGDHARLRRYLGYYLTYCHSASWSGYLVCGATHVFEADGFIRTRSIERVSDPEDGTFYLSKYDGLLSLLGNRIFAVEYQSLARDAIVETVLYPVERAQLTLLRGITLGMSNRRRHPYVSRSVWKFLGTNVDLRAFLGASGLFPFESTGVDPKIKRILSDRQALNQVLYYDLEPYGVG